MDSRGTSSSLASEGKASSHGKDIGEASGVERGEDAADDGRERSGDVRGEELKR